MGYPSVSSSSSLLAFLGPRAADTGGMLLDDALCPLLAEMSLDASISMLFVSTSAPKTASGFQSKATYNIITGNTHSSVYANRSSWPATPVALWAVLWNEYVTARVTPTSARRARRISVLRTR
jgi:hypothetical protein